MEFVHEDCIARCQHLTDPLDRITCRALHAAIRSKQRERNGVSEPSGDSARDRRWNAMFGEGGAKGRRRKPGRVSGVGDAADDRRIARTTAGGVAAAGVIACNMAYSNREERERCIASVNAAHTAANGIIDEATRSGDDDEAATALEDFRREMEEIQALADARHAQELANERALRERAEDDARADDGTTQTMILVGGGVALVAVLGVGYFLLSRDAGDSEAA